MIKTQIAASADSFSEIYKAININSFIEEGYHYCQGGIEIKSNCINNIINSIKNAHIYDYRDYTENIIIWGTDVILSINNSKIKEDAPKFRPNLQVKPDEKIDSNDGTVNIYGKSNSAIVKWLDSNNQYLCLKSSKDNITVAYWFKSEYGASNREIKLRSQSFNKIYTELYPDIDIEKLNECFTSSKEPILILYGHPGVGKTTFLKYFILRDKYKNIAYTKDGEILKLSSFWSTLVEYNYDAIVLDDLDFELSSRKENKESNFINHLLSYSDGIFENSSKVIITTNKKVEEIDSALLRPQRCFDFLILNDLTYIQAKELWINTLKMTEENFDKIYPKKTNISQASLMSNYEKFISGNVERSYLKGDNKTYTMEQKLTSVGISISNEERKLGL